MEFLELITKARSYRRYSQKALPKNFLKDMLNYARLSPSARNAQELKYVLVSSKEGCNDLFPTIGWAGALPDWDGPAEGEKPVAYIVILLDKSISKSSLINPGIAAQSIVLGAMNQGVGTCMIANFSKTKVVEILGLDEKYEPKLILPLGYPHEEVKIVDCPEGEGSSYYRDDQGVHFVPKRDVDQITLKEI